ncbi:CDP-glycerol glycerophosphotransferase family protein [Vibrio crassostreae]|uniref:CDP-glycerol glycerophosphotransferase family protein n=1 Tax=Vibrio crassostreae TaxID=246167 RepID=UPI001050FBDF|nr:CDP-glycerol glycerophosphotransferase family protein [Vibrio crassostreae]TCN92799.1 CDP-glycerol glycerophosphotransferase [Vibrio crassostreae]CAK1931006.1 CDP-glycerol glycerophosphotransferase [Vibrio crassostreae]CAK1939228.1 CDP-glycerol glycerophosphotransferase [Vibrio crassostreae]CAK1944752.1 CDP-glycerol glycerophosphotransferase [Vibrio crassostreae]CAK2712761.1 CDP-glycerol glycerophosphotransferase [Vibrio crassostreae]
MNKDKYNWNRLFSLIKGAIPALCMILFPRKSNRIIFNSEFNLEFNHNSKTLFQYFLKHYGKYEIKFVINDSSKRNNLNRVYGDYFISSSSICEIIYILRAKTWVTSSLETPIGGFFLNFRRNVFHLGHGAPLKNIGLSEGYSNWKKKIYYRILKTNFSYFLSTSSLFLDNWANCIGMPLERVLIGGQSRNDLITCPKVDSGAIFKSSKRKILYAPTWRPFSDTDLFPFPDRNLTLINDSLKELDAVVYLRLHPNFENLHTDEFANLDNICILNKHKVDDINEVLGLFDLVITDYSSIYIDFLLTLRPVVFLPYDRSEYEKNIGFSIDYDGNTPGPKPSKQCEFIEEIDLLLNDNSYYLNERKRVNDRLNQVKYDHSESNAQLIFLHLKD